MKYDWLVVGAGLYGSVFAHELRKAGKSVLVVDQRKHVGGNCYTENVDGINVHQYGAHIFRTSDEAIWNYMRQFAEFNHFVNSPMAKCHGKLYNMPFNMNTFNRIWGVVTPDEARAKIAEQRREIVGEPKNLEEQAIALVGRDVYEILVKEYTEKQWGRSCRALPASILRRLPVRFTFDNNYFDDTHQGIPVGGYTPIFEQLLAGCDIRLCVDYRADRAALDAQAERVLFTGAIDAYYDYRFGPLAYRSLRFEHERHDETDNLQGVAVVNYTDLSVPYTRTIEHKHFEFGRQPFTIVTKEYPVAWQPGIEPYYPISDAENTARYRQYEALSRDDGRVVFGGRLGSYRYTDMQETVSAALAHVKICCGS